MPNTVKIALPAGDLRGPLARQLAAQGLPIEGYAEGSRSYRLLSRDFQGVSVRVFREKDIPIQVALGNYDLGICSLAWIKQMETRFSRRPVVALCDLKIQESHLFAAAAIGQFNDLSDLSALGVVRMASEYPDIADAFARSARLARYRIQPVWGAAEAYPPEDADCIIAAARNEEALSTYSLRPLFTLLRNSVWLIGNAEALAGKALGQILGRLLSSKVNTAAGNGLHLPGPLARQPAKPPPTTRTALRMAVPDGHQQRHVVEALREGGLELEGYGTGELVRRPQSVVDGLEVKVIRPQDMATLVATGDIDIAITGRDCLMEHRFAFPSTPVVELLDLNRGQYNLSAVVSQDLPASTIGEALGTWRREGKPVIRVASEFPATADHYARTSHFWRYQVIPISGASEGFVPEDADLLIEGTETGKTLAENRLKPIDLLYRSTTCVIGNRDGSHAGKRGEVFDHVLGMLGRAAGTVAPL